MPIRIALKQRNPEQINRFHEDTSDPKYPDFGKIHFSSSSMQPTHDLNRQVPDS
jgi:hypothetical protein